MTTKSHFLIKLASSQGAPDQVAMQPDLGIALPLQVVIDLIP
jgi:hypothetical protein